MAQDLIEETYFYAKEAEVYQMAMDFPFKDQDKDLTHHLMALFLDFKAQVDGCFEEEGEESYNVNMDFETFKEGVGQSSTDFWWDTLAKPTHGGGQLGKPFAFYENCDQAVHYPYEEYTQRLKKYSMKHLYDCFRCNLNSKKLIAYKCRGEIRMDMTYALILWKKEYHIADIKIHNDELEISDGVFIPIPDCTMTFMANAPKEKLIDILSNDDNDLDLHVIYQTIEEEKNYTGVRK